MKPVPFRDFRVSIVGTGRLGSTLARRLFDRENPPFTLISRQADWLDRLALDSHPVSYSTRIDNIHRETNFLVLTVPDAELPAVVGHLSQILFFDWQNTVVIHCSGAVSLSCLQPLKKLGAQVGSAHPIQTFQTRQEPGSRFDDIYWGFDGTAMAQKRIRDFLQGIGGHPVLIPEKARPLYHLACVLASNYLVTLTALSGDALAACGVNREQAIAMVLPLLRGTVDGLATHSPAEALTGPIARGDQSTIALHLSELTDQMPHLLPVYTELARETLRLAVKKGSLSSVQVQGLMQVLGSAMDKPTDPG